MSFCITEWGENLAESKGCRYNQKKFSQKLDYMLYISNFVLEITNIITNKMRKAIFMVVLAVALIVSFLYWMIFHSDKMEIQEILMITGLVLLVGFSLYLAFRRLRDVKNNTPGDDEMSRNIMRRGAATSYYVSIYFWLLIMILEEKINLERSSLIGAGIMGMAVIWALSWIYHRFIRRIHD
jgi:hypothetical protein